MLESDTYTYRNGDIVTADDNAFIGGYETAANGANVSAIALNNPAGSGVVILLDAIITTTAAAQSIGYGIVAGGAAASPKHGVSRLDGDVKSVAWLWKKNFSTGAISPIFEINMTAGTPYIDRPRYPFIITEGNTFYTMGRTVNIEVSAALEWREL